MRLTGTAFESLEQQSLAQGRIHVAQYIVFSRLGEPVNAVRMQSFDSVTLHVAVFSWNLWPVEQNASRDI